MTTAADTRTAESLIRDLSALRATCCPACAVAVQPRESLMSIAMGFKDAPRCFPCLAAALTGDASALGSQVLDYIHRHDCFHEAWQWACREEGVPDTEVPGCSSGTNSAVSAADSASSVPQAQCIAPAASGGAADARWDAGDMSCGDLVLELRLRLQALAPGTMLHLTALDPGAPEDIPAWCRLTGNALHRAKHPEYWIRRKG
jgi:tRNA 2-thiouridine synthesizing protein A